MLDFARQLAQRADIYSTEEAQAVAKSPGLAQLVSEAHDLFRLVNQAPLEEPHALGSSDQVVDVLRVIRGQLAKLEREAVQVAGNLDGTVGSLVEEAAQNRQFGHGKTWKDAQVPVEIVAGETGVVTG